jgi:hypothetical protein
MATPPKTQPTYWSQDPAIKAVAAAPATAIAIDAAWPAPQRAIAGVFNRLGGLMQALAGRIGTDPAVMLAVWYVESSGRAHTPGKAVIRFENHLFFDQWGKQNDPVFSNHFRFGGHAGQPGARWENHEFRGVVAQPFAPVHKNQQSESLALMLARSLGGDSPALCSISIGGPQIVIGNFRWLGYATPLAMYNAFQADESAHVTGFVDFCAHKPAPSAGDLISNMKSEDWASFAHYYNGAGNVAIYGKRLSDAFTTASSLLAGTGPT